MRKLMGTICFMTMMAFTACAVTPQSPAQALYEVESNYAAALSVAVAYKHLPVCPAAVLCHKPEVITQVLAADAKAAIALDAAQVAVRTPGFGSDRVQTAIAAASAAMSVLTSLTSTLMVK